LAWLAAGHKRAAVASLMAISPRGVQFHIEKIFAKVGAQNSVGALAKLLW